MTTDLNNIQSEQYWNSIYPSTNLCADLNFQIANIESDIFQLNNMLNDINTEIAKPIKVSGMFSSITVSTVGANKSFFKLNKTKVEAGIDLLSKMLATKKASKPLVCASTVIPNNSQSVKNEGNSGSNSVLNPNNNLPSTNLPLQNITSNDFIKKNQNNLIVGGIIFLIASGILVFYFKSKK